MGTDLSYQTLSAKRFLRRLNARSECLTEMGNRPEPPATWPAGPARKRVRNLKGSPHRWDQRAIPPIRLSTPGFGGVMVCDFGIGFALDFLWCGAERVGGPAGESVRKLYIDDTDWLILPGRRFMTLGDGSSVMRGGTARRHALDFACSFAYSDVKDHGRDWRADWPQGRGPIE